MPTDPGRHRCGVLGHPIGHSLSPVMHRTAYELLGLAWEYDAYDIVEADLAAFVAGCGPQWRGLSLTMPLKRAVLPLLTRSSDLVRRVGVANTALLEDGALIGHNTDVGGVVGGLLDVGVHTVRSAIILGAGATADSVLVALEDLGLRRLHVAARQPARAGPLARRASAAGIRVTTGSLAGLTGDQTDDHLDDLSGDLSGDLSDGVDVCVSTLPGGADSGVGDGVLSGSRVVLDVAYDPWPSPLLARALGHGGLVVDGITMLAHQAAEQVRLMTGQDVPAGALRVAAWSALESRG